ncbi:ATP synthase F1 subunit gamma [Mycoplasmopsis glycophila]|uniref:ATP synthase gamma chain n=1 Tax=Mycoplasmopsis glycophila TaxID=171285 RepID=A0A449AV02_9BACT|nr:ATP synthase F1 subunit gamma [Mycoplasmopsis glycophila]VEU70316.1 ATP synthase F1, gamma subunit [Mycoplasmopsis glycophila]
MANLNSLKNRISVVSNTSKITNAMQLVSTAKLRRIKKEFESIDSYLNLLNDTFDSLIEHVQPEDFYSIFPKNENVKSKIYIVITSDLGLCGSYNTNVINLLKKNITSEDKVIVLGTKGYSILHSTALKDQIIDHYLNYGEKVDYSIANKITKETLDLYAKGQVGEINLIYTKFVNNINQEAILKKLFPLDIEHKTKTISQNIEFEPNAEVVLKNSIPLYIGSLIYCLGSSSKISEMASRRNAMENATNNANELISNLHLQFNRERQRVITQEINEIVAGADAT